MSRDDNKRECFALYFVPEDRRQAVIDTGP